MYYPLPLLSDGHPPAAGARSAPDGVASADDAARAEAEVLTDAFGRRHSYLRIALVERCNLRCVYCMPEEDLAFAPDEQLLTRAEIRRLAGLFVSQGVTKVRLTGGEPLLRPDVVGIARDLGAIPGLRERAITTNGLLLPKKLAALRAAGITHLNVSLDTLRPDRFERMTRRRGLDRVLGAVDEAIAAGYAPLKVNCVVMRGYNDDELADFVAWTESRPVEVRFIEFMPFGGNGWDDARLVPFAEMRAHIEQRFPLEQCPAGAHDTSKTYRVPGFRGQVGFITSMTEHFCSTCNRLRLTADGNLKVCLFGAAEVSLRDAMRSGATDEALLRMISLAVGRKKERHAGMHDLARRPNRPMIMIGG